MAMVEASTATPSTLSSLYVPEGKMICQVSTDESLGSESLFAQPLSRTSCAVHVSPWPKVVGLKSISTPFGLSHTCSIRSMSISVLDASGL